MEAMRIHKPPARFLTDDLVEQFTDRRGNEFPIRLRVWRGKDATAIVLASHVADPPGCMWSPPSRITIVIANHANATIVGHAKFGMIYFEDEVDRFGARLLTECIFEYFGDSPRLKFFKPSRVPRPWSYLNTILGTAVNADGP